MTSAVTWQMPIGRERKYLADLPTALDLVIGGWQYTTALRWYSGRPLLFTTSYLVNGDPRIDNPTRDRWFDTSVFAVQDTFTPRTNPWFYDGLNGPSMFLTDMTLTKSFTLPSKYRLEARIEAYNAFNQMTWDIRI